MLVQEIHHLLLIELLLLHVAPKLRRVGVDDVHDLIVDVGDLMHILGIVVHHGLVDEIVNNTLRLSQLRKPIPVLHLHVSQATQSPFRDLRRLRRLLLRKAKADQLSSGLCLLPLQQFLMRSAQVFSM